MTNGAGPASGGSRPVVGLEEHAVALAQRLVRAGVHDAPDDTRASVAIVAEVLEAAGFAVQTVAPSPQKVSLIGEYAFGRPGRTLLFNGHLDVVPVAGDEWTQDPWGGAIHDGRLYGRGSQDMKGQLAGAIAAAVDAAGATEPLGGRIVVTAVADEEKGGERGTGLLASSGLLKADGAVVVEPGDGGIAVAHRGLCFVELTTHGRSAHASRPSDGVNAVSLMVDALTALRTLRLEHVEHPTLGAAGFAPGTTIHGGQSPNVIPDRCVATIDVRPVPGMTKEQIMRDISGHLEAGGLRWGTEISGHIARWGPPGETPADAEIVGVCAEAFRDEFGDAAEIRSIPAYTDGGWLASVAEIPTVVAMGPGGVAGCHIVDESIGVEELKRYTRVYRGIISRFLAAAG